MIKVSMHTRLTILSLIVLSIAACKCKNKPKPPPPPPPSENVCPQLNPITINGVTFRDLNGNGKLDDYENPALSISSRVQYLIDNMTIEEKAGLMLHPTIPLNPEGRIDKEKMRKLIVDSHIRTFQTTQSGNDPKKMAEDNNSIQVIAGTNSWGIPISISSNPRNHLGRHNYNLTIEPGAFTAWPGTLGLAAMGLDGISGWNDSINVKTNNVSIVSEFADIMRQEYRAVGIHISLAPQADIATEPRWGRISGTFGEDIDVVTKMTGAYIQGLQTGQLSNNSVAAVLKHFPGAGPQREGIDSANSFSQDQEYPYNEFKTHLKPFRLTIEKVKPSSVMPSYSKPAPITYEPDNGGEEIFIDSIAFHFNDAVLNSILRKELAFDGVVISDWGILDDCEGICINGLTDTELANGVSPMQQPFGSPWSVESLSIKERIVKAVNVGIDQFGGFSEPSELIAAIKSGDIPMSRINEAVRRILTQKMQLGIFDTPCVSIETIDSVFKNPENIKKAEFAQRSSQVLLKDANHILPVANLGTQKVFVYGVNNVATLANKYGFEPITNITDIANADMAIIRINTPYEMTSRFPFGQIPFGQLALLSPQDATLDENQTQFMTLNGETYTAEYKGSEDYNIIKQAKDAGIPVVLSIYMDRPMIITELAKENNVIVLANFGAQDEAVFDIITGASKAAGRLPFSLPKNWKYIPSQGSDRPSPISISDNEFSYGKGIILR